MRDAHGRPIATQADLDRDKILPYTYDVENEADLTDWLAVMLDKLDHHDPTSCWSTAYDQAKYCLQRLGLPDAEFELGPPISHEAFADGNEDLWRREMRRRLKRLRDYLNPLSDDERRAAGNIGHETYLVSELCKKLGDISSGTLNRHAKSARVTTPRRGQRNFRYSMAATEAICSAITSRESSDTKLVKAAREIMAEINSKSTARN